MFTKPPRCPRRAAAAIALTVTLGTLAGCGTVSVTRTMNLPAAVPELRGQGHVALVANNTSYMQRAYDAIFASLRGNHRLAILPRGSDRGDLEQAARNDDGPAILIALGAGWDYHTEVEQTERRRCNKSAKNGKCLQWSAPMQIRHERCKAELKVDVVDVRHNRALEQETFTHTANTAKGEYGYAPDADRDTSCSNAMAEVGKLAAPLVGPRSANVILRFREVKDGVGATKEAIGHMKTGRDKNAGELFPAIPDEVQDPTGRAWAHFNYGLFLFAVQDFPACVQQANRAAAVLPRESDVRALVDLCQFYHRPRS